MWKGALGYKLYFRVNNFKAIMFNQYIYKKKIYNQKWAWISNPPASFLRSLYSDISLTYMQFNYNQTQNYPIL